MDRLYFRKVKNGPSEALVIVDEKGKVLPGLLAVTANFVLNEQPTADVKLAIKGFYPEEEASNA